MARTPVQLQLFDPADFYASSLTAPRRRCRGRRKPKQSQWVQLSLPFPLEMERVTPKTERSLPRVVAAVGGWFRRVLAVFTNRNEKKDQ